MTPLAGDASLRRYFVLDVANYQQLILVMADHVCNLGFVQTSLLLQDAGVATPQVLALQPTYQQIDDQLLTCLLVSYVGDQVFLHHYPNNPAAQLAYYQPALAQIHQIQTTACQHLQVYDAATLTEETDLFANWFVPYLAKDDKLLLRSYPAAIAVATSCHQHPATGICAP